MIRSLICTFIGHVDHGKTTIQDYIRGTSIAKKEPGLITQHISGTKVDFSIIKEICGDLLKGKDIKLPGFLFLDTPGHASFNNLRKRGSNLIEDSEALCNKIESYISTFYAFKSYIQLVGLAAGLFCPIKEVQLVGFAVAGGAFALDWVMDWIAGLPETRRIITKLSLRMRNAVDQEELGRIQLTRDILARAEIVPTL